jgi:hypothetical protein
MAKEKSQILQTGMQELIFFTIEKRNVRFAHGLGSVRQKMCFGV